MDNTNNAVLSALPLGAIMPAGWLANQLRIQADGLGGHLDEFWPDVAQSKWIGGDREGWERAPYWLDGFIPLAYLLQDQTLVARAQRWMDYILEHQHADGWLGEKNESNSTSGEHELDPWPMFVLFKAMAQYQEATGDARIVPAMQRAMRRVDTLLDERPLTSWAKMRWMDFAVGINWLYARTGESWLLGLRDKAQAQGYDWVSHFADFRYTEKATEWLLENHVVNHAMALKEAAVRDGGMADGDKVAQRWIDILDRYHGQANGMFSGDESLAGTMPSQGTELCSVVEYLYSLQILLARFPCVALADRMELIAYNALPATFTPDMWGHQYDQQTNQVQCVLTQENNYTNNGPDANLYGLEPNFGCCTANMHQGWPKLAASLWMSGPGNGLTALAYAPCDITTKIGGAAVCVHVRTEYPFRDQVEITVHTDQPITFALNLRIPGFVHGASVQVDGVATSAESGSIYALERTWNGMTTVVLNLPMTVRLREGFNGAVSVLRGPLLYSLLIGEEWTRLRGDDPAPDWEVRPTTPWYYALQIDRANPAAGIRFSEQAVGGIPFSPAGAPIRATATARTVSGWTLERGAAAAPPQSPVNTDAAPEEVTLIPYGCTNIRITEFPTAG